MNEDAEWQFASFKFIRSGFVMDMDQIAKLFRIIVSEEIEVKLQPLTELVNTLQNELDGAKEALGKIKSQLERREAQQSANTLAMIQAMNSKVDRLQKDVELVYLNESMHELEINRLKLH
jgi:predicted  nucleic acid-binding Zn-ribbon protein